MEDMSMYQKTKFANEKSKQKKLIKLIEDGKHELVLFEVPKNFNKDILDKFEFSEADAHKHVKVGEDYWMKCIKDSPHINSLCIMINKDGQEGTLDGNYKLKSYFKIMKGFKETSKSRISSEAVKSKSVIHKDKVKLDIGFNPPISFAELQSDEKQVEPKSEKKKKDKKKHKEEETKKKKEGKEKKEKKSKKEKKEKSEKKEKAE